MIFDVKDGSVVFNVSKGLVNYSQKNNEYIWQRKKRVVNSTTVCNTTSVCMGSSYAGWRFPKEPYSEYNQEEDRLTKFALEDPRVSEYYKKTMPALWKAWKDGEEDSLTPNEVHKILAYATNLWFGTKVVEFSEALPLSALFTEIIEKNLPVVVSGNFPKESGSNISIGHIAVLVGLIYNEKSVLINNKFNLSKALKINPVSFIFDDPWGDFMQGYEKKLSGNDIVCPYDLALKYLKPCNEPLVKWGYTFTRGAAIS
jgi:hypothetical protein